MHKYSGLPWCLQHRDSPNLNQGMDPMAKAAPRIHFLDLADDLQREVQFAPDTKYVVTVRRELMARVESALRFAVNPTEEYVDRVAHAIVAATAPLFDDFHAARDAARAAIEVIGL
jgi:hypothetical protein